MFWAIWTNVSIRFDYCHRTDGDLDFDRVKTVVISQVLTALLSNSYSIQNYMVTIYFVFRSYRRI